MKKFILTTAMGLLFFVGLTSMISMEPPYTATQCQTDCAAFVEAGIFSGQGACMSACASCTNPSSSAGSFANCQCKIIRDVFGFELFGFSNYGECVNTFKSIINGG